MGGGAGGRLREDVGDRAGESSLQAAAGGVLHADVHIGAGGTAQLRPGVVEHAVHLHRGGGWGCEDVPQRAAGSVGVRNEVKKVANDRLSTRGYQALMKAAVFAIDAQFFYVFTDWRMWSYLFDLAEGSGAGVRSMIVWNKGNPGMGRGWRAQHELVLWGCRASPPYEDGFGGLGNVRTMGRQSNDLHTTQKPVELMRELIRNTPFAKVVADPFGGSGTTLIACEKLNRQCRMIELDPKYADVIVRRWEEFTGKKAELVVP